jgi:integral membrane sensor domain MASE1
VDDYDRDQESPAERIDRNWVELLQELRVSQTGVQILTGFLLILPVQPTFHEFSDFERGAYVVTISACIIAACLLISPVAMHRALFRKRRKESLVAAGHTVAKLGLGFLGLAIVGVVCLVFSIVLGQALGLAATAVAAAMFLGAWVVLPLMIRHRMAHPDDEALADQKGA